MQEETGSAGKIYRLPRVCPIKDVRAGAARIWSS
jgi:hypothetical protein